MTCTPNSGTRLVGTCRSLSQDLLKQEQMHSALLAPKHDLHRLHGPQQSQRPVFPDSSSAHQSCLQAMISRRFPCIAMISRGLVEASAEPEHGHTPEGNSAAFDLQRLSDWAELKYWSINYPSPKKWGKTSMFQTTNYKLDWQRL